MVDRRKLPWMAPPYRYREGGWIYMGKGPATDEDFRMLEEHTRGNGKHDPRSILGRHHPDWTALCYVKDPNRIKLGGLGSKVYQLQKVGEGVDFLDSDDNRRRFHFKPGGGFTWAPLDYPRTKTAFYKDWMGLHAGPKPGSEAYHKLGNRAYHFHEKKGYWLIV